MSQGVAVSSVRQVLGRSRSLDQPCTPRLRGPTPEEMQQPASPSLSQHANSPAFSVAWPRDCLGRVRQRQPPPCASMHVPWRCSCCVIARGSRASRACASRAEVGVQVCWVKQCCILDNNHTAAKQHETRWRRPCLVGGRVAAALPRRSPIHAHSSTHPVEQQQLLLRVSHHHIKSTSNTSSLNAAAIVISLVTHRYQTVEE